MTSKGYSTHLLVVRGGTNHECRTITRTRVPRVGESIVTVIMMLVTILP